MDQPLIHRVGEGDTLAVLDAPVVLDFGDEEFGSVLVTVVAGGRGLLRVDLGESVSEAIHEGRSGRELMVDVGDRVETGVNAFRFARVEAPGLTIRATVQSRARPVSVVGSFRSSDPRLDAIWRAGARTACLCAQDRLWDGIKRGRSVWAGDLHPASAALAAAAGPHPAVAASLDHLRDRHEPDAWMNGIPTYSLWWIITHLDLFLREGDVAYLRAQVEYLRELLVAIGFELGPDGREEFRGWRYLDWATTNDPDAVHAGTQALLVVATRAAGRIAAILGDDALLGLAIGLRARAERVRPVATASKAAHALRVLAGRADPVATNQAVLKPDPAAGLTPFLGYHVLEARAMAGDHRGAMDLIRVYWGAMIDLGATTLWEDFDLAWADRAGRIDAVVAPDQRDVHAGLGRNAERGFGLSLCHAWSAGPTAWLSRHVLGVEPVEPGYAAVAIHPELGDLDHAEGAVPTPHGLIRVRHARQPDGSIQTDVDAPAGVTVRPPVSPS